MRYVKIPRGYERVLPFNWLFSSPIWFDKRIDTGAEVGEIGVDETPVKYYDHGHPGRRLVIGRTPCMDKDKAVNGWSINDPKIERNADGIALCCLENAVWDLHFVTAHMDAGIVIQGVGLIRSTIKCGVSTNIHTPLNSCLIATAAKLSANGVGELIPSSTIKSGCSVNSLVQLSAAIESGCLITTGLPTSGSINAGCAINVITIPNSEINAGCLINAATIHSSMLAGSSLKAATIATRIKSGASILAARYFADIATSCCTNAIPYYLKMTITSSFFDTFTSALFTGSPVVKYLNYIGYHVATPVGPYWEANDYYAYPQGSLVPFTEYDFSEFNCYQSGSSWYLGVEFIVTQWQYGAPYKVISCLIDPSSLTSSCPPGFYAEWTGEIWEADYGGFSHDTGHSFTMRVEPTF